MKQIFIFIATALFLVGCGGGSSSSSSSGTTPNPPSSDVIMVTSQPYTVFPGDQVVKAVPEAIVRISHIDGQDESTIVLLEGNATIIRQ